MQGEQSVAADSFSKRLVIGTAVPVDRDVGSTQPTSRTRLSPVCTVLYNQFNLNTTDPH